jgi:hypothetical protein
VSMVGRKRWPSAAGGLGLLKKLIIRLLQQSYAGLTDCHGYKKTDLPLQHTFEAKLQTSLILLQW